jgi:Zn finger protein HypA/HybF involved in hydrogenase expression
MVEADPRVEQSDPQASAHDAADGTVKSKPANLRMIIVGAVLVAGVSGFLVWNTLAKEQPPAIKSSFTCVTEGCGFHEARVLTVGETLPLQCPKCGKNSLYVSHTCPQCRTLNVMNEVQGLPGTTKCSQCGAEIRHEE